MILKTRRDANLITLEKKGSVQSKFCLELNGKYTYIFIQSDFSSTTPLKHLMLLFHLNSEDVKKSIFSSIFDYHW